MYPLYSSYSILKILVSWLWGPLPCSHLASRPNMEIIDVAMSTAADKSLSPSRKPLSRNSRHLNAWVYQRCCYFLSCMLCSTFPQLVHNSSSICNIALTGIYIRIVSSSISNPLWLLVHCLITHHTTLMTTCSHTHYSVLTCRTVFRAR